MDEFGVDERFDMLDFCSILVDILPQEHIGIILQEITKRFKIDRCPICRCQSELRDKVTNRRLGYGDDLLNAEWHEMHEVNCAVVYLSDLKKAETE